MSQILVLDAISGILQRELEGAGLTISDLRDASDETRDAALAQAEGIVVRSRVKVNRDMIERAPNLRVIGRAGAGTDNIDTAFAAERGVYVLAVPGGNEIAVAELALGLMLALARKIVPAADASRRGEWAKSKLMGIELCGETLGVLGLGRIGARLARMALALDMKVVGHDPYIEASAFAGSGIEVVPFEAVLERARFLSIHVPLTDSTRGLLGVNELARMRSDAFVLQCARGGIVDETALAEALENDRLAGAGLDVFESEPNIPERLATNPKVIATPHIGGSTRQAQDKIAAVLARELIRFFTA